MAAAKCNCTKIDCGACSTQHPKCHPCYPVQVGKGCLDCCGNTIEATAIDSCNTLEYCTDGCEEILDAACITTRCGTLEEVIDKLLDENCEFIVDGNQTLSCEDVCECLTLGTPLSLTLCTNELVDIKQLFLDVNDVDTGGVIKFISGITPIFNHPTVFDTPGIYQFEYALHNPCYKAQLITVTIENCNALMLTVDSYECLDGEYVITGTYVTNGSIPMVVTDTTITDLVVNNGNFSFKIVDNTNEVLSFYLENEVQSEVINIALQVCEPCLLMVTEIIDGCTSTLELRNRTTDSTTDVVTVIPIEDSTEWSFESDCVLFQDCQGVITELERDIVTSSTSLMTQFKQDVVVNSVITSIDFIAQDNTVYTIPLAPGTAVLSGCAGTALATDLDSNSATTPTAFGNAIETAVKNYLCTQGFSVTALDISYFYNGTEFTLRTIGKHNPANQWVAINSAVERNVTINTCRKEMCDGSFITIGLDSIEILDLNTSTIFNYVEKPIVYGNLFSIPTTSPVACNYDTLTAVMEGCINPQFTWSTGETTATIITQPDTIYTLTSVCEGCNETITYTTLPDLDVCKGSTNVEYDCDTGVITVPTEYDTITIDTIGVVTNGQIIAIPDGTYLVTFTRLGCLDKTNTLVVDCVPQWEVCESVNAPLLCNGATTLITPTSGTQDFYTVEFVTNFGTNFVFSYDTSTVVGDVFCYNDEFYIVITNIGSAGEITFDLYAQSNFLLNLLDLNNNNFLAIANC